MKYRILLFSMLGLLSRINLLAQSTGTFTDNRDGKVYKTAIIGTQTWMAENLAYKTKKGCWAYGWDDDNKKANISKYGYLYEWKTAKNVCPSGWHLASKDEWETMFSYLGGQNVAGEKMKSSTGWGENDNSSNSSGFSALPGGYRVDNGDFDAMGNAGYWWTATESDQWTAFTWILFKESQNVDIITYGKSAGGALSVRCIKD